MRRLWFWLAPWLLFACAPALPSETPLGEGPLAKAEHAAREKSEQANLAKADSRSAEVEPSAAAESPPDTETPPPPPTAAPTAEAPPVAGEKPQPGKKPTLVVVYAGEYVGSDTSTYKFSGAERSEKDDKAKTRVSGAGPEISVTFIDSGNGSDICTLKAQMTGKTGSFAAGQKCWGTDGPGTGTLTRGSAQFDDKKLIIDADFQLQMGGEGDANVSGQLHYRFEGTRK
ncbi:MAG: hypothetical protein IPI67_40310 [Myxococcales bacterium]|nr:hypothetical protein [Myxococcales bacterium]